MANPEKYDVAKCKKCGKYLVWFVKENSDYSKCPNCKESTEYDKEGNKL